MSTYCYTNVGVIIRFDLAGLAKYRTHINAIHIMQFYIANNGRNGEI